MFEKTIRLDFVQRRLQQALLVQLVIVVISKRTEFLSLENS